MRKLEQFQSYLDSGSLVDKYIGVDMNMYTESA